MTKQFNNKKALLEWLKKNKELKLWEVVWQEKIKAMQRDSVINWQTKELN